VTDFVRTTNSFISSLVATLANITSLIVGNSTTTNATITNASTTNLIASNATSTNGFFSNLVATLANITNLVVGNSTTTNAVTTYLTANTSTIGTSTVTGNEQIGGTLSVTGTSTLATTTASKISKGQKLTIYLGIDPTGPTLHLGHAIAIKKLSEFQKAGHKVILLMGDFTAMIGDPTDKSSARVQLTHKQVLSNLKNYKKQASNLISFSRTKENVCS
jgi:hypothetical protein